MGTLPVYNMSLRNLEYRLRAFQEQLPQLLEDTVMSQKDSILTLVKVQLYRHGIDGSGRFIMDYAPYSPRTIANKKRKGQATDRVTLYNTGAFYKGFKLVPTGDGFSITSDDYKTDKLVAKYGPRIFRLTDKNFNFVVRHLIRLAIVKKLRDAVKTAVR